MLYCWLLAVGCWLLVVGCWLLAVVGCWLLVVDSVEMSSFKANRPGTFHTKIKLFRLFKLKRVPW